MSAIAWPGLLLVLAATSAAGGLVEVDTHGTLMRRDGAAIREHEASRDIVDGIIVAPYRDITARSLLTYRQDNPGASEYNKNKAAGSGGEYGAASPPTPAPPPPTPAPPPPPPPPGPATLVKWELHPGKCWSVAAAEVGGGNASVVLWDCSDNDNLENMQFRFPLPNNSGMIQWDKEPTKCATVRNGWTGNGNIIHLSDCIAPRNPNFQRVNFTHVKFDSSSWIEWSPDPDVLAAKILDVDKESTDNGAKIEIWDMVSNTTWLIYEPEPTPDPALGADR